MFGVFVGARPWAAVCLVGAAIVLAGCTASGEIAAIDPVPGSGTPKGYEAIKEGGITVPAVPPGRMLLKYQRRLVTTPGYAKKHGTGVIVVDTARRYLFYTQPNGKSWRYGIGVGRAGFGWAGEATIRAKKRWPSWHPPKEMVARDPLAAEWAHGMPGGIRNPLGARALYLFQGNRDTLYRLHGTNDPESIGKAVSSGCVRLLNHDIVDLYKRVPVGTKVVVLGEPSIDEAISSFFSALIDV